MSVKESIERRLVKRLIRRWQRGTGWCKDEYAKDKDGKPVDFLSEKATCFCLSGGLRATCLPNHETHLDSVLELVRDYASTKYGTSILPLINDRFFHKKADAIRFLQDALVHIP